MFSSTICFCNNCLSVDLPLGSPIIPVAPPSTTIGLNPALWKWRSESRLNKFPMWSALAVGSNPI